MVRRKKNEIENFLEENNFDEGGFSLIADIQEGSSENTYIENLEKRFEKEPDMRDKITEQIADAKKVLSERGEIVPLAALLTVYPPNKTGVNKRPLRHMGRITLNAT